MQTLTLPEAQQHLIELVHDLRREGELVITDADKPVARLSPISALISLRDLSPKSVGAVHLQFRVEALGEESFQPALSHCRKASPWCE